MTGTRPDPRGVAVSDVATIEPIDRNEMVLLARTEYDRLLGLLHDLDAHEWDRPTACDGWNVRDMAAHLLGAAEASASLVENIRQALGGWRRVRGTDRPLIDGINDRQVEDRRDLTPTELIERLGDISDAAVRGRRRLPAPIRRLRVPGPFGDTITLGFLVDVVYTRDEWMHRVDIAAATGRDLVLTAAHDGRIVADVVRDWATTHGEPVTLHLDGPAGGSYRQGVGGPTLHLDAVEFTLAVGGRTRGDGLLAIEVVF